MAASNGKESASPNPLVLSSKASESIQVHLHPLVLLTISDYITRHTLRSQTGPIIGAIIGAQDGRQVTLEHAFECKLVDGEAKMDAEWFTERLESYREVHKAPSQLELVGLFAMGPVSGPEEAHIPVMQQAQAMVGQEGLMLLLFHPDVVGESKGGKLPISLYETVHEAMEGSEAQMKFKELAFEVETGEAEMIGVDTVAKGGGSATATTTQAAGAPSAEGSKKETKGKGKGKAKAKDGEDEANGESVSSVLSPEDDELIASLTAKANAIKMLTQRLQLIKSYLETLPTSYLTDSASNDPPPAETNYSLLRSVNAMLSRVPLLSAPQATPTSPSSQDNNSVTNGTNGTTDLTIPTAPSSLPTAGQKEREDVHLTSLLAALSRSVAEAQSMGSKFHILSREKQSKERSQNFGMMGGGGGAGGRGGRGGGGFGGFAGDEGLPEGMASGF